MNRLILAAGGLLLATANTPPGAELDSVVAAEAPKGSDSAAKPAKRNPPRIAVAPEPAGAYPRCSSTVRDRCAQGRSGTGHSRHREIRLAMRAGERG